MSTASLIYDSNSEIAEKMAKNVPMLGSEKYDLQTKINNNPKYEDHEEIFRILVRSGSKYTTNTSGTYFDLNEVENVTLWKIRQYMELTMQKLARERVLEQAEQEKKIAEIQLTNRLARERKEMIRDGRIPPAGSVSHVGLDIPYSTDRVPTYDELRTQALFASDSHSGAEMSRARTMGSLQPPTNFGSVFRTDFGANVGNVHNTSGSTVGSDALGAAITAESMPHNPGFGSNFVSGGVCIRDEDLETETEGVGTELTLPEDDVFDEIGRVSGLFEGGFEDDGDGEEEDEEDDEDEEEDDENDPAAMIRNGGQGSPIEPGFDYDDYGDDEANPGDDAYESEDE